MPSIERIEQFHETLAQLGDEPAIAAERDEIIEPPERPDQGLDDDLSALLGDFESESEQIAQSQAAAAEQAAETEEEESDADTSALLANLDDLFSDEDEGEEAAEGPPEDDPFASIDLGDDDFPVPPDFTFDPDAIPDEIPEEELEEALNLPEEEADQEVSGEELSAEDLPDEGLPDEDFSLEDFSVEDEPPTEEDFPTEDEPPTEEFEPEDDFGELDELGDLSELDETIDEEALEDLSEDDVFGDLDDLDEIEDIGDMEDLGDLGDLGDVGDLDEIADLGEAQDTEGAGEPSEMEDADAFGEEFGSQVESEFGDEPFGDFDDESFELPSVDEDLEGLEEEGFSLGDFGEEFDIDEESIDEFAGLELDTGGVEGEEEDLSEAPGAGIPTDRKLTDREFSHLQETLNALPLNVKIATEETIGKGQGSEEELNKLIDALIAGSAPSVIAEQVSRITGTRLQVPKGYQKRSGLAFEEEKRSLRYQFVHVVLPVLRVAVIVIAAVSLFGFLSYRFVYRPIHAEVLYRRGYTDAQEDRFQQANDTFERAWDLWPRTRWFSRYARVFVDKRQYDLAVEKYDQLVFGMDPEDRAFLRTMVSRGLLVEPIFVDRRGRATTVYDLLNVDREGILEHGALQSEILANYQRAEELYSILLYEDDYDYDGLMARGDNYLRWAEEDPARFEDARLAYAGLLAGHGDTDPILMRFLRFFVRTDNQERVEELVNIFERVTPRAEIEPEIYAEAAGYLLDKGVRTDVRNMLIRAYGIAPRIPEIHYHLARYNRTMRAFTEERNALDNARASFAAAEPLSRRRLRMQIDTEIRSAEYWYERDEMIRTVEDSDRAVSMYEEARQAGLLDADPMLARVYAVRGDVEYYTAGDLPRALGLFDRAAAEGYVTEELNYKRGFINYELERFDEAIERFYAIGSSNALEGPENLLYARANTLFRRGNYVGAEAMYRRLRRTLYARRDRIPTLLVEEDPAHRALIEFLYRVNNNLGVTLYRQTLIDTTRPERFSEGLVALQESAEIAENYLRDPDTGQRPLARNLAYLNIREILNPTPEYEPQIFQRLPRDMDQVLF